MKSGLRRIEIRLFLSCGKTWQQVQESSMRQNPPSIHTVRMTELQPSQESNVDDLRSLVSMRFVTGRDSSADGGITEPA
jgi:hypothetical protein